MQLNNALKSKLQLLGALAILFSLYSCGSFQYAGSDNDGVYGESNDRHVEQRQEEYSQNTATSNNNSDYYKDYFKEKSEQYNNVNDNDDVIFTDIDSYQSDYVEVENDSINYESGYAGWGEDNTDITINVYGGHRFNSIWWNRPYYTTWGWNYGYGYGWGYDPYWWPGASWYVGWNNPWWFNNYYYRPFYNGYYGGYYNGYYGRRRAVAYNATRRGHSRLASNQLSSINRRSGITRSRSNTSSRINSRVTRPGTSRPMVRPNNSTRPRVNTTRPRTTRPMVRPNNSTRPKVNSTRPRTTTRPRANTTRPRTNNRSGGFSRSSSSRSSGMRSSGGSRSRRNN